MPSQGVVGGGASQKVKAFFHVLALLACCLGYDAEQVTDAGGGHKGVVLGLETAEEGVESLGRTHLVAQPTLVEIHHGGVAAGFGQGGPVGAEPLAVSGREPVAAVGEGVEVSLVDGYGQVLGSFAFHPFRIESLDAGGRVFLVEKSDEVVPGSIAERIGVQIVLQGALEGCGAHALLQLAHHDGCLVVDDVAVEQTGTVQVGQRLLDGVGAVGAVGGQRRHIMGLQKTDVVVHIGKLLARYLVGHEVGEHFLGPHIVEPPHGDKVAEPQVRGLVGQQVEPVQLFVGGRVLT